MQNKQEAEFDWGNIYKDILDSPVNDPTRILDIIKSHCVPRADYDKLFRIANVADYENEKLRSDFSKRLYSTDIGGNVKQIKCENCDTAREIAEDLHNQLLCADEKLKKIKAVMDNEGIGFEQSCKMIDDILNQ